MKIKLQIAELNIENSCHEDWNKMLPEDQGKFCLSCKKAVHDFTSKTTEEVMEFFQKRKLKTACVRVNSNVLNQPKVIAVQGLDKLLKKRLAWFAYALYLVFGSVLFSCNSAVQNDMANPN
ncbi:MAG TPA: hypothetical protein VE978_17695, partial [Chitinophagales bacterium]|nr:hypothetical protein [Chitinophagales bacterium]